MDRGHGDKCYKWGDLSPCTSSESYDGSTGQLSTATAFSGLKFTYQYSATVGYLSAIVQYSNASNVYWTAKDLDASLRLNQESMGNGAATITRVYDETTGNLTSLDAQGAGGALAELSYGWNKIGTLADRDDTLNTVYDNFCYDDLNRLVQYSVNGTSCSNGSPLKTIGYDGGTPGAYANGVPGDGNISSKSDVGTYTNGGSGAGPHAVTSIQSCAGCNVNGQTNPTFSYDADGNMTADAGRTAQYTSFDIASSVGQGNNVTSFTFTPEHGRGSRTFNGNTMYYLNNPAGGVSEELWTGATSQWDTYLTPYGHIAAELFTTGGTTTPYYFVGDHLESVTALSDASGNQEEYHSFDAWGNGRARNGNDQASCPGLHPPSLTLRGYTSQETIASYCIIDLNARNYDPAIGRMMGGDPVVSDPMVSDPMNGQAHNAYSYALNEPLVLTDPTGEHACDDSKDFIDTCQTDPEYDYGSSDAAIETVVVIGHRSPPQSFGVWLEMLAYDALDALSGGGGGGNDNSRNNAKATNSVCTKAGQSELASQTKGPFINSHANDATAVANELNVTPADILGLSALESGWGNSNVAINANNFFGQHYSSKVPEATGSYKAAQDGLMAVFSNYSASVQSFASQYGSIVQDTPNPTDFAAALQDSGKFGVDKNGNPVPSYVSSTAATINGIAAGLACR